MYTKNDISSFGFAATAQAAKRFPITRGGRDSVTKSSRLYSQY
jgi:hypothetical protein